MVVDILYPLFAIFGVALPLFWYWNVGRFSRSSKRQVYAFFHPYCSGGGGGERVLWKIVQSLQSKDEGVKIVIFTIDPPSTQEAKVREEAQRRFDVSVPQPIALISLEDCKNFLDPQPFLSLVMESWGTMKLAAKGLRRYAKKFPNEHIDVYWDTTGCAFTFLVARWVIPRAWIFAYVHYPTISTDMMAWEWKKTQDGRPMYKTIAKLVYYWIFSFLYGRVGSLANLVLVNSTWTYAHIRRLWGFFSARRIHIVYPPCRVPADSTLTHQKTSTERVRRIVSIGQFRPEKDHALQIECFAALLSNYPQHKQEKVKLLLIGSCRNKSDENRVSELQRLVEKRNIQEFVSFLINPPYADLQEKMKSSLVGIHTMRQEHFGIGIVEMMAAGLITVAHDSGGPKSDIIRHRITGYLATTPFQYAEAIHAALTLPPQEVRIIREHARASATRFSDRAFDDSLSAVLSKWD